MRSCDTQLEMLGYIIISYQPSLLHATHNLMELYIAYFKNEKKTMRSYLVLGADQFIFRGVGILG